MVLISWVVEGTARALYQALTMEPSERAERAAAMRESIEREDITAWLHHQLADINALPN